MKWWGRELDRPEATIFSRACLQGWPLVGIWCLGFLNVQFDKVISLRLGYLYKHCDLCWIRVQPTFWKFSFHSLLLWKIYISMVTAFLIKRKFSWNFFWLTKGFIRTLYVWRAGETCTCFPSGSLEFLQLPGKECLYDLPLIKTLNC